MLTKFADKSNRVRWGYITAFILLLSSYILTYYSSQNILTQQQWVSHTNTVIKTLDNLSAEIKEAESSFRGYLISKNEIFLSNYYKVPQLSDSILNDLRSQTSDNPLQQKRLDTLQKLIINKLDIIGAGISIFKKDFVVSDTLRTMGTVAVQLMNTIKLLVARMQFEENSLLLLRTGKVTNISNFIKVINAASLVIAIVLVIYSVLTFNKHNIARQKADKSAERFREELELRVKELAKLNIELMELRAIEKFAATGRIARTIAHEVRNPLTNINLATEHLRSEIPEGSETELLFNMITRNCNRINELISDLLNSTRETQLTFEKTSIDEVLDSSLKLAHDRIELKKIKVIINYDPNTLFIHADIEKLKIAFLNIIVNAIEAMQPDKGILEIKTEEKNDRCVVTIKDNGIGMNKESLTKLFEPYFTTKPKGTGLGLTNTQNIILSHHANVYAESIEGKGTSFIVSFNCA